MRYYQEGLKKFDFPSFSLFFCGKSNFSWHSWKYLMANSSKWCFSSFATFSAKTETSERPYSTAFCSWWTLLLLESQVSPKREIKYEKVNIVIITYFRVVFDFRYLGEFLYLFDLQQFLKILHTFPTTKDHKSYELWLIFFQTVSEWIPILKLVHCV